MSIRESQGTPYTPEDFGDLSEVSPAEATVLKLLRQKDLDKVTVVLREGKILRVEAEGDIAGEDLSDRGGMVRLRSESDFETLTVTRHNGKVVKARRIRPFPFTEKENRRVPYETSICTSSAVDSEE